MECHQDGCTKAACFRYTWPGKDEAVICLDHAAQIQGIGDGIGMPVQMIPLPIRPLTIQELADRLEADEKVRQAGGSPDQFEYVDGRIECWCTADIVLDATPDELEAFYKRHEACEAPGEGS